MNAKPTTAIFVAVPRVHYFMEVNGVLSSLRGAASASLYAVRGLVRAEMNNTSAAAGAAGCGNMSTEERAANTQRLFLGIFIATLGGFVSSFGLVMQKYAHKINQGKPDAEKSTFKVILGFACYICGTLIVVSSMPFAPQSVIAALTSVNLVGNAVFAPCLLHEKITKLDVIGTCFVVAGIVLVVVFGQKCSLAYTAEELVQFFVAGGQVAFFTCMMLVILGVVMYIRMTETGYWIDYDRAEKMKKRAEKRQRELEIKQLAEEVEAVLPISPRSGNESEDTTTESLGANEDINDEVKDRANDVGTVPSTSEGLQFTVGPSEAVQEANIPASQADDPDNETAVTGDPLAQETTAKERLGSGELPQPADKEHIEPEVDLDDDSGSGRHASGGAVIASEQRLRQEESPGLDTLEPISPARKSMVRRLTYKQERRTSFEYGLLYNMQVTRGKQLAFFFAFLSAALAAYGTILVKIVGTLIETSFTKENQFVKLSTWVFIIALIAFEVIHIQYLNHGLKCFEAMFFVPLFQVCITCLTSICGGIFFQEFLDFTLVQQIMYPLGLATTVTGVFVLTQRDASITEGVDHTSKAVVRPNSEIRRRATSWPPPRDSVIKKFEANLDDVLETHGIELSTMGSTGESQDENGATASLSTPVQSERRVYSQSDEEVGFPSSPKEGMTYTPPFQKSESRRRSGSDSKPFRVRGGSLQ